MEKKSIKVSFVPKIFLRTLFLALIIGIILFTIKFILESKKTSQPDSNSFGENEENNIVLPFETGVADSGFENNVKIASSNAKILIDDSNVMSGGKSLGIYFFKKPKTSATVEDYLNEMDENGFYRLSFWAVAKTEDEKKISVNLSDGQFVKNLGEIVLPGNQEIQYYDFNFQAEKNCPDLIFSSNDEVAGQIWIDNVLLEKLEIDSSEQLGELMPTISGNTATKNIDNEWENSNEDSENFLSENNRKIGQIFKPSKEFISGAVFKVQNVGHGGTGNYNVELREYNEALGTISSDVLASYKLTNKHPLLVEEEIAEKEKQMRDAFNQNEEDIKAGLVENDPTVDQYPPDYTQEQIDKEKAKKRQQKLSREISEMKESYNEIREIETPISAKINPEKKYWIGISNSEAKTDKDNYLKVFYDNQADEEVDSGFISDKPGEWKEFYTLWTKIFYPNHRYEGEEKILSGATISDFGKGKVLYRYQFGLPSNSDSQLGFFGKKIYDLFEGQFENVDIYGNYPLLKSDDYVIYQFNTLYPAKKITIREGWYHKNLILEFSNDRENWQEIFSDSPMENGQKINPISISPEVESNVFYLRARPESENSYFIGLFLEAELIK